MKDRRLYVGGQLLRRIDWRRDDGACIPDQRTRWAPHVLLANRGDREHGKQADSARCPSPLKAVS
jgi:hypothetical protein